jgi:hypothetical protein
MVAKVTTSDLLAYLGDATRFPFFGGWVAPAGSNPQISVAGVTMDAMPSPAGDQWLRAYYRKIQGNNCDVAFVDLYVANYGQPPATPMNCLSIAGLASALGDPLAALAIYGAIVAAAQATPPNPLAQVFLPLLTPGNAALLDFADPATTHGIAELVAQGVLTTAQQAVLAPLAIVTPTNFA